MTPLVRLVDQSEVPTDLVIGFHLVENETLVWYTAICICRPALASRSERGGEVSARSASSARASPAKVVADEDSPERLPRRATDLEAHLGGR